MGSLDEIKLIPDTTETQLNQRQLLDYRTEREQRLTWLLEEESGPVRRVRRSDGEDPRLPDGHVL